MISSSVTTPAASLECAACDAANRPDRQFCGSCGARLWAPCLSCGRTNAAAEKHCGACGANLPHEVERARAALDAQFAQVNRLADEQRHAEAIHALQAIQVADHSALATFESAKAVRISALRAEMLSCNRKRDEALAAGRELLAACDYEQAAIALEAVAEPYRTGEHRELLDEVRGRQINMLTLVSEIRRAVAAKETDGLLPKVEELLRIKPDHAQAISLAQRLRPLETKRQIGRRDALYTQAKAELARYDYAAALALLEQIPQDLRTRQLVRLIDDVAGTAAETDWLARDLRQAVGYDEHHLAIADRLAKLRPGDAEAASFLRKLATTDAQIGRRAQAPGSQQNPDARACRLIPFEPPATSFWGPPLETIVSLAGMDTSALDCEWPKSSPDQFCVAAGLALQGLNRALLNVNLAPREKAGLLGLLKTRKKAGAAWGVDVGRTSIKAIRLSIGDDDRIIADAANCVEHSQPLGAPDSNAEAVLGRTLDKLIEGKDLRDASLCISVSAHKVLYRPVALPLVDKRKLPDLMKFEVREQIPIPTEHVVWGYQRLGSLAPEVPHVRESEVALLALKLEEAHATIAPFVQRGLKIDLLTSDAAALLNFVMYNGNPRRKTEVDQPHDVTAILDVGADSSNFMLTDGASIVMRSIPLGGNSFSRTIVKEFQLTFAQAEKVKRNPTAVRELHRLYGALEPRFVELERELNRTINGYLQANPARRLTRFVATGGGLKLHGALRRLWHGQ